jgi:peptidoglycan/LPS O-acetylase OafA/YrhL
MAATVSTTHRHIPALDGVRGIAIILVLVFHAWRTGASALGWTGVDLFFVLSGFLITGILADSRERTDRVPRFFLRRALRIMPLYYGVLLAVFVLRPLLHVTPRRDDVLLAGEQAWYWTYLCAWRLGVGHPRAYTFLTHFWSLSIEEQFYLAWPWIVWFVSRRRVIAVASVLCVVALLARAYFMLATPFPDAAYMLPPCRMDALAVGAIVALAIRGPGGVAAAARWIRPAALAGAATLALLALVAPSLAYTEPLIGTIGYTAIDWAAAGLVMLAITRPPRLLASAPLRAAGRYSYGMYVVHPFVNWWAIRHAPVLERTQFAYVAGVLAISTALAVISYHVYESRFLRLKDRLAWISATWGGSFAHVFSRES